MGVTTSTSTSTRRWPVIQPWISTAARVGLAVVWLYAGGSKVTDLDASARAVNAYQIMPYDLAKIVGGMLPFVEVALGLLLLAGLATRLIGWISAGIFVIFIAGIISAWARGLSIDCGCFGGGGELSGDQTPAYLTEIFRDLGFLVLAGFLVAFPRTRFAVDSWLNDVPEEK